jgi:tetratricopeptide (TPR) repeat protein
MIRPVVVCFGLVAGLALAAPHIGATQQSAAASDVRSQCDRAPADARVKACTTLIDAGSLAGRELGAAYVNRGRARVLTSDFAGAIADFTRALELLPGEPMVYEGRGLARVQSGDADGAIADLTEAIAIDPTESAYGNRGMAWLHKKDFDRALADLTKAIDINPNNPVTWMDRGRVKGERRDPSALDDLNKAIELRPGWADAYSNRGLVKRSQRDLAGALADLNRALELQPQHPQALNNRGSVRQQMGDFAGANADLTALLALDPGNAKAYGIRADVRRHLLDFTGALADIESGLKVATSERPALQALQGALQRDLGNLDAARASLDLVLAARVTPEYVHFRGVIRTDQGDHAGALGDFQVALKLEPTRDYAAIRIWMLESRLGRRTEATATIRARTQARRFAGTSDWVLTLSGFLDGSISEDRLVRAAVTGTDAERDKDRECEAYFYAGWVRLLDGNTRGARSFFERVVRGGRVLMVEYGSARAELTRLK